MSWKTKQSSNSIPPFLVFNSCCDMFLNHVMIELKQWSNNSRLIIKSSLIMMIPCYTIACYTIFDPRQPTKKKCRRVKAALKAIKNVAQFLPQTSIWICRSSQCLKILKKSHSTFTMCTFWLKMPKNSQFQLGGIFEKFKCDILVILKQCEASSDVAKIPFDQSFTLIHTYLKSSSPGHAIR